MGLVASQTRLLLLVGRKSDLELHLQFINQARLRLANMITGLSNALSQIADGQKVDPRAEWQLISLQQVDKSFELQAQRINTQHQAVETEIGAVTKVIQKNIASSFKLMG